MIIKAMIFDLDGVLTDTAEYHYQAWSALASELGIPFSREDNEQLKGVDRMGSLDFILAKGGLRLPEAERQRLADNKNRHYQQLIETMTPMDLFDGVTELFATLKARQIAIGLASSSKNAPMVIERLGIEDAFDYVADAAKIAKGKPHPEIFLTVAKALGVHPQEAVGVEDSLAGLQGILDAGMHSVGIGDGRVLQDAEWVYPHISAMELDKVLWVKNGERSERGVNCSPPP
ncbi:beta-phosphoglucomutase [Aliiglaciecola sp. CAU 1673]|uniref:beta-phosphoglucomutase n=1 Tax=Aliiglaciecola sp. CAU 1673 TaxID=3032595 RepID=UPI0023DAFAF5|nr:beta-phosphoglucomutase [Aliiglaciecola sp. CAU 1673]MDF2178494.1 beta-phosphoglucomutase [Aliiglaciecola sp. CAU 1673]